MSKLADAFEQFDTYNKTDPHVFIWEGVTYPQEYFLALKLYEWVKKLDPAAGDELLLASRSQHLGRWQIPRETYPGGREGYLKWRRDLAFYHADKASAILQGVGYAAEQTDRIRQIILKQKIKADAEVQVMENALCLVFLQFQYEDFYHKHPADKVVNILKKSLLKMDGNGHRFALMLPYTDEGFAYIKAALELINSRQ